MFKFLKEKLKAAVDKISGKVEKEIEQPVKVEEKAEYIKEVKKPAEEKKIKEVKVEKEAKKEIKEEVKKEEVVEEVKEKKKGFFEKIKEVITTKTISVDKFNELFWDLELALLENNVAVEVIEKIKNDLKEEIVERPLKRGKVEEVIEESLKKSIEGLFIDDFDLEKEIKKKKPYVIVFFGINGGGKTTSISKLAYMLKKEGFKCVLAAADTFRAAAIQQLEEHGKKLDIKVINHDYGSDPAAVAFDAIKHAEAKGLDVVLVDTAGRMHSNTDLIREMEKIVRVSKPDLKIFVGEAITGNDCVEQASVFNSAIGIDGIILAKQDIDEKGGASVSISYVTKKPILYLGVGQRMEDLIKFDKEKIIKGLGL